MLAFDSYRLETCREKDCNGFLHVALCNITKEQVVPYYGREIPNYKELGFLPDEIYYGYRPADELKKGAETFNNLPLLDKHIEDGAEKEDAKKHRVGSLGDKVKFNAPYLQNSLIVYDQKAIDKIEDGTQKELSCAYRYDPIKQSGEFGGQRYDFVMTNIRGNHVALVEEGRAGSDVVVADENTIKNGEKAMAEEIKKAPEVEIKNEEAEKKPLTADAEIDKRKAIDEIGGMLKGKVDDELWRTIIGKIEELSYNNSEDGANDEEPKDEEDKKVEFTEMQPKEGEDKCAKDEDEEDAKKEEDFKAAMDSAVVSAKAQVRDHFKKMAEAVNEVKGIVNIPDMFAFDSADDIYKKALEVSGIDCKGCSDYRGMVRVLRARNTGVAMDSKPAKLDGNYSGLANIKKGF